MLTNNQINQTRNQSVCALDKGCIDSPFSRLNPMALPFYPRVAGRHERLFEESRRVAGVFYDASVR
jgi:hypothetical protein